MEKLEQQGYIFGAIFALANKLQVLGNTFDKKITIKQWLFLVSITKFNEPPMITEIASFIGFSRQNAKRMAESLAKEELLIISTDKKDARAIRLKLTQKCINYFSNRGDREIEFINNLFNDFDEELTGSFYNCIIKLTNNIELMENNNEKIVE